MSVAPIAIVGAGASGLMAALWAAGRGRTVVVLDGTDDGGRKILISGGGRCNILPSQSAPGRFVTDSSPHTLRKILGSWPLPELRRFFEEDLGLPIASEPETGKLFPATGGGSGVRETLVRAVQKRGAEIRFRSRVTHLSPHGGEWRAALSDGTLLTAGGVVLATGGCSFPGTGSDGWGFEVAGRLGHHIYPTYPALVPLTADPPVHSHLAGISLDVTLEAPRGGRKTSVRGGFLFTHRGYSGPVVLDLSHLAARSGAGGGPRQELLVRWTELEAPVWEGLLSAWRGTVQSLVARHLPSRLAETLCRESGIGRDLRTAQLQRDLRIQLLENLTRYRLPWTGNEGYLRAETTGGGVDLVEVAPRSLESRLHPGLFLCGEVLDAFGPIGGHNFQWAWATGKAAGLGAAVKGETN